MGIYISEIREEDGTLPAYAWPGGYSVVYLMADGEILCADCINNPTNPVTFGTIVDGDDPAWQCEAYTTADWREESETWQCAHCYEVIE